MWIREIAWDNLLPFYFHFRTFYATPAAVEGQVLQGLYAAVGAGGGLGETVYVGREERAGFWVGGVVWGWPPTLQGMPPLTTHVRRRAPHHLMTIYVPRVAANSIRAPHLHARRVQAYLLLEPGQKSPFGRCHQLTTQLIKMILPGKNECNKCTVFV